MKALRLLTLFAAVLTAASCGDGLSEVLTGDFRCLDEPCEINFGRINLNRQNETAKVRVQNIGEGDLEILDVRIEGSSPFIRFSDTTVTYIASQTDFEWTLDTVTMTGFQRNDVTLTLTPSNQLEVELIFSGSDGGHGCPNPGESDGANTSIQCGHVVVASNDRHDDEATLRVPILLDLGDSRMVVDPTVISFAPPQLLDAGSDRYAEQQRQFTITNSGTGNMDVLSVIPGSEELRAEQESTFGFPLTVIPGAQSVFNLIWQPTTDGELDTQVRIESNAFESPNATIFVDSEGGDTASIEVDPCDFFFPETPAGDTTEMLFDVTNTGGAAMTWSMNLQEINPHAARGDFALQNTSGQPASGTQDTLPAGNSRTMQLVYTPTEDRSVTGKVRFAGNFGTSMTCTFAAGPAVAEADVAPSQLYWGGMSSGDCQTRSFVVANVGRAPLEVSSIDEGGDTHGEFSIPEGDSAGFTVDAGSTRRVEVTYCRQADDLPAVDTATLTINHDGGGTGVVQVFLTATHGDNYLPPTCHIAVDPPEPYTVGTTVDLDATGSETNAGDWAVSRFQWNLDRPGGSGAALATEFGDATSVTFDVPGTYVVGLTATALVETTSVSCELLRNMVVVE